MSLVSSFLRRYLAGVVRHRLIIAVVVASAFGVALTSRDVFMTPIAAATMAGITVVFLQRLWQSARWSDWKHLRAAQFLSMAAVPVAFSTGLSVDGEHLFRQAFATDVPAQVRQLSVDANVLNPAGTRTVLMRFTADPQAVSALLKRGFAPDPQMGEAWAANVGWGETVRLAFSNFANFGGSAWADIAPMAEPDFYIWRRTENEQRMETRILWDARSKLAYVLYTVR